MKAIKILIVKIVLFIFIAKYYHIEFDKFDDINQVKNVSLFGLGFQYIYINGNEFYSITRNKLY
jgi:hypothetical protein